MSAGTLLGTITRRQVIPTPGRNFRFAWRWLYAVNGVDIGTSLKSAESWAKQRGMKPVRAWEAA
jgi:hypothetical protein